MVRTTLSAALAVALLGFALPSAPALACGNAQCPLTVSMEPTGPAPQPLAEGAQAASSVAAASKPVRLDRFRRKAAGKATRTARQEGSKRARATIAYRSSAKTRQSRQRVTDEQNVAAKDTAKPVVAKRTAKQDVTRQTASAGASAFALQSYENPEVKVVPAEEVNALDLAAGPSSQRTVAMVATPAPVATPVETTGRAVSLDSLTRQLSQEVAAGAPAPTDDGWMRKMLLVLGGAFAAAAAAARLLLAA